MAFAVNLKKTGFWKSADGKEEEDKGNKDANNTNGKCSRGVEVCSGTKLTDRKQAFNKNVVEKQKEESKESSFTLTKQLFEHKSNKSRAAAGMKWKEKQFRTQVTGSLASKVQWPPAKKSSPKPTDDGRNDKIPVASFAQEEPKPVKQEIDVKQMEPLAKVETLPEVESEIDDAEKVDEMFHLTDHEDEHEDEGHVSGDDAPEGNNLDETSFTEAEDNQDHDINDDYDTTGRATYEQEINEVEDASSVIADSGVTPPPSPPALPTFKVTEQNCNDWPEDPDDF